MKLYACSLVLVGALAGVAAGTFAEYVSESRA